MAYETVTMERDFEQKKRHGLAIAEKSINSTHCEYSMLIADNLDSERWAPNPLFSLMCDLLLLMVHDITKCLSLKTMSASLVATESPQNVFRKLATFWGLLALLTLLQVCASSFSPFITYNCSGILPLVHVSQVLFL